ncbi:MAG: hypothetical protein ACREGR_01405 [Minisyncoccia bacterium]
MKENPLTYRVNAYFAVLILTIFGAGASLVIIHVANAANVGALAKFESAETASP